ncbi:MAG: hypothetical protein NZV14_19580 [Bryobacteraceae bacterium]|nr:hypothetical protein [Bryobacteraceae bacterium]MDW8380366.1 hypothetical protein [Bryobacterales bacterium]
MFAPALLPLPRLLLVGLDSALQQDLGRCLPEHPLLVLDSLPETKNDRIEALAKAAPDLILCPMRDRSLGEVLEAAAALEVPVVVVSRLPNAAEWLDALEAGAADYLAVPFERRLLEWVLAANRRAIGAGR